MITIKNIKLKNSYEKTILLLVLYFFTACTHLLVNNEKKLIVTYKSSGCFHSYTRMYEFKNNEVTIYNEDKKIGTTKTTAKELNGLRKLFEFYDNNKAIGLCTTLVSIQYKLYQGDKLLESKFYRDYACTNFEDKNITTLYYFDKKLE